MPEAKQFMCRDLVENIIDYIDKELDYETLKELEKHLDVCPECEAFVRTYRKMLELAGNLRKRSFVPPEVRDRLRKFLKSYMKRS